MKKILLFLISIIAFIGVINAEEFVFNFRSPKTYAPISNNLIFKDGYIFTDSTRASRNGADLLISYYDLDGKKIKEKREFGKVFYYLASNGDYFYAFGEERESNFKVHFFVYKYNENLELVASKEVNWLGEIDYQHLDSGSAGIGENPFIIDNNQIKILSKVDENGEGSINEDIYVITLDLDLTTATYKNINETNDFKEFVISRSTLFPIIDVNDNVSYMELEKLNNDILVAYNKRFNCFESNIENKKDYDIIQLAEPTCYLESYLALYDQQGNLKWQKEYKNYQIVENVRVTDKYIVVIGNEGKKALDYLADILIYDHNGNLVQTIPRQNRYTRLDTNGHQMVFNSIQPRACLGSFPFDFAECYNNLTHEVYSLEYNISTRVTKGSGKVEAIRTSKPGEKITFVVTPGEGYTLGEVKGTDKHGNTLIFKDYTFTMPSDDVLVEATFLTSNPETKDIAIALIIMLAVIALVITLIESKKLKKLGV